MGETGDTRARGGMARGAATRDDARNGRIATHAAHATTAHAERSTAATGATVTVAGGTGDTAADAETGGRVFRDDTPRNIAVLVAVGLLCGVLSGMFGIGGGTIIVPALVWLGLSQRHAAATSLAAIVPTSISGVIAYATGGDVDWIAALLLIVGVVVGSQLGSLLLSKLPEVVLRWVWVVFLLFVVIEQLLFVPDRGGTIDLHALSGLGIAAMGVVVGTLAGVLGIGGGAIMIPGLSFLFGASDLIARGTSLLAMFPGALTGTAANWRRGLVHLKAGLIIGVVAAFTAPLGTWVAELLSPRAGNYLFAAYLTVIVARSAFAAWKVTKKPR